MGTGGVGVKVTHPWCSWIQGCGLCNGWIVNIRRNLAVNVEERNTLAKLKSARFRLVLIIIINMNSDMMMYWL